MQEVRARKSVQLNAMSASDAAAPTPTNGVLHVQHVDGKITDQKYVTVKKENTEKKHAM